jgi:hypothetical protein
MGFMVFRGTSWDDPPIITTICPKIFIWIPDVPTIHHHFPTIFSPFTTIFPAFFHHSPPFSQHFSEDFQGLHGGFPHGDRSVAPQGVLYAASHLLRPRVSHRSSAIFFGNPLDEAGKKNYSYRYEETL